MHELSIALSILDLAAEEAALRGDPHVVAVHLKLGLLSGVVPQALRSAYNLAREGSALADSELVIEEVPVVIYCAVCAAERPAESMVDLWCPACKAPAERVVRGRELEVVALEIEE